MTATNSKPELVIGIVAKIGTDLETINEIFSQELIQYSYKVVPVKVTKALEVEPLLSLVGNDVIRTSREERYSTSMDACNKLREKYGNDIMAKVAVTQVTALREQTYRKR